MFVGKEMDGVGLVCRNCLLLGGILCFLCVRTPCICDGVIRVFSRCARAIALECV